MESDLTGNIVYDDPSVFRRLRIDGVDDNFVLKCAASLKADNTEDVELLKQLTDAALREPVDVLEYQETCDRLDEPERNGNHGSCEEKEMYDPLIRIFSYIANYDQVTHPPSRVLQTTDNMLRPDEAHIFGFQSVSPDFTLSANGVDARHSKKWYHRDAFGEVKPSKKQRPKPAVDTNTMSDTDSMPETDSMPKIVLQSAAYARLFLSARPFMLSCVGILIFGTEFCIGIFDRDGITFSPIFDMFEDTETLVRVVHRLACDLSIEELGHDPTIRVLSDQETKRLTGESEYSSAVVAPIGSDPRPWCTIGPPIWTSHPTSISGHNSNVWLVREYVAGDDQESSLRGSEKIMKTAWRSSARTPESDIYLLIERPTPKGLAEFVCGGDVVLPGRAEGEIPPESSTAILHRLVLGTVGRPMWKYESELDLLTGFRDALQAHKALCERGILHCDISAGNILLNNTPGASPCGFITDLEFARIKNSAVRQQDVAVKRTIGPQNRYDDRGKPLYATEATTRTHIQFGSPERVKASADMTGTIQFMARNLLLRQRDGDGNLIEPEATHDVESFIWVLSYCVMRNLFDRASHKDANSEAREQCQELKSMFGKAFGQTTSWVADERQSLSIALEFPQDERIQLIIEQFMSKALVTLFKDLQCLTHSHFAPREPTLLTHNAILAAVDKAITSLPT